MSEDTWSRLARVLSALAHPTRLKILALCAEKERTRRELRELLGISKPLLIAHLKVLRNAGLVEDEPVLDEERFIVKRICRTRSFRICISPETLKELLEKSNDHKGPEID